MHIKGNKECHTFSFFYQQRFEVVYLQLQNSLAVWHYMRDEIVLYFLVHLFSTHQGKGQVQYIHKRSSTNIIDPFFFYLTQLVYKQHT